MSGDSGIKIGTGSGTKDGIPITVWHNMPFVQAMARKVNGYGQTIYPNWNSACTYGYNLPTANYRGKFEDLSPIPFNNGAVRSALSRASGPSEASGASVWNNGNDIHIFYPTHPSIDSCRQKVRGYYYDAWDDYLTPVQADATRTTWNVRDNGYHNAYLIKNSNCKIKDGWIIYRAISSSGLELYSECHPQVDCVYYDSGTTPNLYYAEAEDEDDDGMYLTDGNSAHSTIVLDIGASSFLVGGDRYHMIKIYPTSLNIPSGKNVAIATPKLKIVTRTSGDNVRCEIVSYGFTLGQI